MIHLVILHQLVTLRLHKILQKSSTKLGGVTDKSSRTQKNLVKLSNILESYGDSGQRDFSITQIGRVSSSSGGPGYEAIRATRNKHYRTLIEAWASYYQTNKKETSKA